MTGDVKFIRVRGRIVPIRRKNKEPEKRSNAPVIGAAVGAKAGVGASLVAPLREEFAIRKGKSYQSPTAFKKQIRAGDILMFTAKDEIAPELLGSNVLQGSRFAHSSVAISRDREALLDMAGGKVRKLKSAALLPHYSSEAIIVRPVDESLGRAAASRARSFVKGRDYDVFRAVRSVFGRTLPKRKCKDAICFDVAASAYRMKRTPIPQKIVTSKKFKVVARLDTRSPQRLQKAMRYGIRPLAAGAIFGAVGYGVGKLFSGRRRDDKR